MVNLVYAIRKTRNDRDGRVDIESDGLLSLDIELHEVLQNNDGTSYDSIYKDVGQPKEPVYNQYPYHFYFE